MSSSPCPWEGNTSLMTMANGEVMPWYQMCPQVATTMASMAMSAMTSNPTMTTPMTMTGAMSAVMSTSTPSGNMNMGMGSSDSMSGGQCQMSSMLWNWQTIDACFISSQWHIKTGGDFAGTCISVVAWGMLLQALLRVQREFDRFLVKRWTSQRPIPGNRAANLASDSGPDSESTSESDIKVSTHEPAVTRPRSVDAFFSTRMPGSEPYQLKIWQQAIRAWLHAVDFGASYLFMLMAMYYNGYILICMFLGQLFGFYVFSWDTISGGAKSRQSIACC